MRFKVFAAAAALSALGGAALVAQEHRRVSPETREKIRAEIGLSDEQVTEIRRIKREAHKEGIQRHADLRVARMELDDLLGAPTLDEGRIAASVKRIADLQAASLQARTDSQLAVRKLVTPEQFQKMQQLRQRGFRAHRARRTRGGPESAPRRRGGSPDGGDFSAVEPS